MSQYLFLLTVAIIVAVLIIDTSIPKFSVYVGGIYPLKQFLLLFISMVIVYSLSQYAVMRFLKEKIRHSRTPTIGQFRHLLKAVQAIQYIIVFLLLLVIFQMITSPVYSLWILKVIAYTSYGLGTLVLMILAYRFISWSRSNRSIIVILYVLAVGTLCINSVFTILALDKELYPRPNNIRYSRSLTGGSATGETAYSNLLTITHVISFSLTWAASAFLSRSYWKVKNTLIYWGFASIPLVYFFSQYQPAIIEYLYSVRVLNPQLFGVIYSLLFNSVQPIGGFIFGMSIWHMSRKLHQHEIREYMKICAYGMILMFASNQITGLNVTPFPPFGLVTSAFFGLSSFLYLVGIYFSAISVAQDISLRKYIRNYAKDLALLDGIGSSEMKQETETLVKRVMKDVSRQASSLELDTGIPLSLEEQDLKEYLRVALAETRRKI
jgi:hypothetical protein